MENLDALMEECTAELIYDATGTTKSPGGQKAGSHPTSVRITHTSTGLMAQCGDLRSQHKNREVALKMIAAGLKEING